MSFASTISATFFVGNYGTLTPEEFNGYATECAEGGEFLFRSIEWALDETDGELQFHLKISPGIHEIDYLKEELRDLQEFLVNHQVDFELELITASTHPFECNQYILTPQDHKIQTAVFASPQIISKIQNQDSEIQPQQKHQQKKVDVSSALLLVLGIVCGILAYRLTESDDASALILIPSVICATVGALNLVETRVS